ncbi:putative MACPF domain-containing protein CAD1/NSL1 [Helianthus debilis subsp. tardiflorus]
MGVKICSWLLVDKPPIDELQQFLEFQLPRQLAPVFNDLPLGPHRKQQSMPSLQFSFCWPRLYINTSLVIHLFLRVFDSYMTNLFVSCFAHCSIRFSPIKSWRFDPYFYEWVDLGYEKPQTGG